MASFDAAAEALRARLRDNWSATPVAWQNVAFDPEEPGGGFPAGGAFLVFEVLGGAAGYASLGDPGNNLHRQRGEIRATVFVPSGEGDSRALDLAEQAGALFRGQRLGGALCRAARLEGGEAKDVTGRWWRRRVVVPFQVDERA